MLQNHCRPLGVSPSIFATKQSQGSKRKIIGKPEGNKGKGAHIQKGGESITAKSPNFKKGGVLKILKKHNNQKSEALGGEKG